MPEELRIVEDEVNRGIVQMQREVRIKSITDGKLRRFVIRTLPSRCPALPFLSLCSCHG